jgi:hypothetical protein
VSGFDEHAEAIVVELFVVTSSDVQLPSSLSRATEIGAVQLIDGRLAVMLAHDRKAPKDPVPLPGTADRYAGATMMLIGESPDGALFLLPDVRLPDPTVTLEANPNSRPV